MFKLRTDQQQIYASVMFELRTDQQQIYTPVMFELRTDQQQISYKLSITYNCILTRTIHIEYSHHLIFCENLKWGFLMYQSCLGNA